MSKIIVVRDLDGSILKALYINGSAQFNFKSGRVFVFAQIASSVHGSGGVGIEFPCDRATAKDLIAWMANPNQDCFSVVESRAS